MTRSERLKLFWKRVRYLAPAVLHPHKDTVLVLGGVGAALTGFVLIVFSEAFWDEVAMSIACLFVAVGATMRIIRNTRARHLYDPDNLLLLSVIIPALLLLGYFIASGLNLPWFVNDIHLREHSLRPSLYTLLLNMAVLLLNGKLLKAAGEMLTRWRSLYRSSST